MSLHLYLGYDDEFQLILKSAKVAVDLSGVTKMVLDFSGDLITSENTDSDPIRWAKEDYQKGEIRLFLGQEEITPGSYFPWLYVYDADHPHGIPWGKMDIFVVGNHY